MWEAKKLGGTSGMVLLPPNKMAEGKEKQKVHMWAKKSRSSSQQPCLRATLKNGTSSSKVDALQHHHL